MESLKVSERILFLIDVFDNLTQIIRDKLKGREQIVNIDSAIYIFKVFYIHRLDRYKSKLVKLYKE